MLRKLAGPLFVLAIILFLIGKLGGVGIAGGFHKTPGIPGASGPCPGVGDVTSREINGAAKDLGISCKVPGTVIIAPGRYIIILTRCAVT